MDTSIIRCDSTDADFRLLVRDLDRDLLSRYGANQSFFDQFNAVEDIRNVVVLYVDGEAVGCGAFKQHDHETCEVKRMYVAPRHRGKKLSRVILSELERWALECGFSFTVLETGIHQPEAIAAYERFGYERIPNYPPYIGVELSVCYRKKLPVVS
jgi:putative acetyltransferase